MTDLTNTFNHALTLAKFTVWLGILAVICFCVFGTLASMAHFKDSTVVYYAFHYLPYLLIAISIPISLYHLFLLHRYRIVDGIILLILLMVGLGLLAFALISYAIGNASIVFFMSLFLAMIAWFGMPFLIKVNLQKFLSFLQDKSTHNHSTKQHH